MSKSRHGNQYKKARIDELTTVVSLQTNPPITGRKNSRKIKINRKKSGAVSLNLRIFSRKPSIDKENIMKSESIPEISVNRITVEGNPKGEKNRTAMTMNRKRNSRILFTLIVGEALLLSIITLLMK
ncbi:MAG: hypothetical protein EA343_14440 [Nodularia sp. (in: Bacteria)]|nr:MAG: hypothetical protein EA343_14440 [Nodularia sp. (in: cyanobacteria)]